MSESLFDRLQDDMKSAMKARDKQRLAVLRNLVSKIKGDAIDDPAATSDEGVTRILLTYAKQREEGLVEARKAGRDDLAAGEEYELEVVRGYLPEPLGDEELEALVAQVVADTGASSMKDMGKVMKEIVPRAGGRADGSRLSAAVKKRLAG